MTKNKKKTKQQEKKKSFMLKRGNDLYIVTSELIESFPADEAFRLALTAHIEQKVQLVKDAIKGDHYVDDVKIVDGLEASLNKLEERFPFLRKKILDLDTNFLKIGKC